MFLKIIVTLILGYLLGCIPGSMIVSKIAGRRMSGDTTVTGVLRATNIQYALIALAIEAGKGFIAALLGDLIVGSDWGVLVAGIAVMLGHVYNIVHGFHGAKGISPYGGIIVMLDGCWWVGLLAIVLGAALFTAIKAYRLVAVVATLIMAILLCVFGNAAAIILGWLIFALVIFMHKEVFMGMVASKPNTGRNLR